MLEADESMFGDWKNLAWVCGESERSEFIFTAESIDKDADNMSPDDPKNEFDALDDKSWIGHAGANCVWFEQATADTDWVQ